MVLRHALAVGCAIAALSAAAPGAGAQPPGKYENTRWNMVALTGGVVYAGVASQGGGGLTLSHGRRFGSLHWAGEYTGMIVEQSGEYEATGLFHRLGVSAKYPAATYLVSDESMEIAFWLEAGAGVHRTAGPQAQWRGDMVFGWAAEFRGFRRKYDRDKGGMGFWLGARILVSETGKYDAPIALGAPTRSKRPFDAGLIATFGWRWGR